MWGKCERAEGPGWSTGQAARPIDTASAILRSDLDLDLAGLGFLAQRQPQRQHAVLVFGGHLGRVDRPWQRKRPAERAVTPLHAMEMLFLDLAGQFLLAFDGQGR